MNAQAEQETDVLFPDRTLEIGGRTVVVREFTFRQGLDLGPLMVPMMADLDAAVGDGSDMSGLLDVFYAHPKALRKMLLLSTGEDEEWLDSLDAEEGDALVLAMYSVNASFFVRRFALRRMARQAAAEPTSQKSS